MSFTAYITLESPWVSFNPTTATGLVSDLQSQSGWFFVNSTSGSLAWGATVHFFGGKLGPGQFGPGAQMSTFWWWTVERRGSICLKTHSITTGFRQIGPLLHLIKIAIPSLKSEMVHGFATVYASLANRRQRTFIITSHTTLKHSNGEAKPRIIYA